MKLCIGSAAQAEIEEAAAWYEAQRQGLAAEFLAELDLGFQQVTDFPHAWHPTGKRTRQHRLNRFPYGIVYQIRTDEILIVAIAHLRRRPGYWRNRSDDP
jgi:plasmid stabilization system protein ParE